jgi:type IV pilus assembly protein PilY1
MKFLMAKSCAVLCGALLALGAGRAALADDTEIFFNQNNGNIPANIMFILDTSGSMNDLVTSAVDYVPATGYAPDGCAAFDNNYYYFGNSGTPACGTANKILKSQFKCASMLASINSGGFATDAFAQWGSGTVSRRTGRGTVGNPTVLTSTNSYGWKNTLSGANTTGYVECKADAGVDGDGVDNTKLYASTDTFSVVTKTTTPPGTVTITGTVTAAQQVGVWDPTKNFFAASTGGTYTIYSANYMNYLFDSTQRSTRSKISVMRTAAAALLNSLNGVNVGLMRYNWRGSGGMVMYPVTDVAANRTNLINMVQSWAPTGITPLSETYFEAYRYFAGGAVDFGNASWSTTCTSWTTPDQQCSAAIAFAQPSVAASRSTGTLAGANYKSPADQSCRKNFIVYLTDGLPNENDLADNDIKALPNFASLGGSCDAAAFPGAYGGLCTAALAQYMYNADLRPDVAKVQNVTSYFIGFGADFTSGGAPTAAYTYLNNAATRGGGKAYTADSLTGLTSVFNDILAEVIKTNTTFSAPAVAVNAFNRTQTLNDLYFSVFSPRVTFHWPGNVKKYKVVGGAVVDSTGAAAIDPNTGFFLDSAKSYWSAITDGADVTKGGAASDLPDFATRTIYTYTGSTSSTPVNATLTPLSALVTDATVSDAYLNIGNPGDPDRAELVAWAEGQDTQDIVPPVGTADSRHEMGDPIHTQPVAMIYGKKGDGSDDTVVFVPTNDGYLHAIDASVNPDGTDTPTSGRELWSFIPYEMLPHLKDLYDDDSALTKHYGLDGQLTLQKYDINGDGIINGNDRVLLFFGTGHNAETAAYYALDVTDRTHPPKLLWRIDASTLPGLGQAWSAPVLTRINVNGGGGQNSQRFVLVLGGGYDVSEDNKVYNTADGVGNHIYIIDALYGQRLWYAGLSGADFNSARMTHAIPATVSTIDLDGDGYADRLYVGDMAGQIWRFDITNGQPAATLVTGGVLASLGTKDDAVHAAADVRRFYGAVDVSPEQQRGVPPFINIAVGSGYRGHPLDTTVHDRFYSVRDYNGFNNLTQANFASLTLVRDALSTAAATSKLLDITTTANPVMPAGALGWQLDLNTHPDWTAGEKVMAPARTFNGSVLFTTYSPNTQPSADPCAGIGTGTNRAYMVNVMNGAPVLDRNKDGSLTTDERSQDLRQGGIAPEVALLINPGTDSIPGSGSSGGGGGCRPGVVPCVPCPPGTNCPSPPVCLSGGEAVACPNFNQLNKTYWREGMSN